jgi:hypothetical protein
MIWCITFNIKIINYKILLEYIFLEFMKLYIKIQIMIKTLSKKSLILWVNFNNYVVDIKQKLAFVLWGGIT